MGLPVSERPTRALVDLDRIAGNLRAIREHDAGAGVREHVRDLVGAQVMVDGRDPQARAHRTEHALDGLGAIADERRDVLTRGEARVFAQPAHEPPHAQVELRPGAATRAVVERQRCGIALRLREDRDRRRHRRGRVGQDAARCE